MKRFAMSLVAVSIAIVASSCAVTSPATNVSTTSATLNGKGFTTDQPAEFEFQYAVDYPDDLGTPRGFKTPAGPCRPTPRPAASSPTSPSL